MLCEYMAIHITRFVEIDLGGQTAYLLSAKVASTTKSMGAGSNSSMSSLLSYYNRFDFGYGVGAEVHPFMGICVGVRYSVSLTNLYKNFLSGSTTAGQQPSFVPSSPSIDLKNNVVQIYLGYRF
jgi:Outer membrane protein beta-barrel domain